MKFKIRSTPISSLFVMGIIVIVLSACHPQARSDKPMISSVEPQRSMNRFDPGSNGTFMIPRTGQTKKFMTGDDGDTRAGRPWPEPRFTENGDGTVTDRLTGLMWTRNADKAHGTADWEQAILGAGNCKDGGYADWRLPNRNELESLIDLGRYNPALPKGHPFTGVQPSYYWTSSTTSLPSEDDIWVVHFYIGFVTHDDKAGSHHVWYVRDSR
jgi:hypothetical protein